MSLFQPIYLVSAQQKLTLLKISLSPEKIIKDKANNARVGDYYYLCLATLHITIDYMIIMTVLNVDSLSQMISRDTLFCFIPDSTSLCLSEESINALNSPMWYDWASVIMSVVAILFSLFSIIIALKAKNEAKESSKSACVLSTTFTLNDSSIKFCQCALKAKSLSDKRQNATKDNLNQLNEQASELLNEALCLNMMLIELCRDYPEENFHKFMEKFRIEFIEYCSKDVISHDDLTSIIATISTIFRVLKARAKE